ncbi:MAG: glycosyltransferase [Chloroflexi bacterium]|nr:MAG: glycosyltransferase [Chloroflexota bacterium]
MTLRIDQFHTNVSPGSSITNQILNLQDMLRGMGYHSRIVCEQMPDRFPERIESMAAYTRRASAADVLLLHFSLNYSQTVMDWLKALPCRKVLIYHNITPHAWFAGINNVYWEAARTGRAQLSQLRPLVQAGWGDSAYNCRELQANNWEQTGVLPIIFNPARVKGRAERKILKRWQKGVNILFVGRISPNKRLEDVILSFYYFKQFVNAEARLFLMGAAGGMERYLNYLQTLVQRLALRDVFFTGHTLPKDWRAYYQIADIYLSMSEHEGFGIPLLESMYFEVPIIAYKAAAIPETLGGSGILISKKNFAAIAELMGLVVEDHALRAEIIAGQNRRLQDFMPSAVKPRLEGLLNQLDL